MRVPFRRPRARSKAQEEVTPLDPVALALAIWLGVIAGVTGMLRMSENAEEQAHLRPQPQTTGQQTVGLQTANQPYLWATMGG